MSDDTKQAIRDFKQAVNMTPNALEHWLQTEDSKEVGQKGDDGGESTGHRSGRRIVDLLHKKQADYSEDDVAFMHHVISYVRRHMAQRPEGDIEHTRWRYSLMNWGHDPMKKD